MPITLESSDAAISSLVQLLLRENVLPSFLYPDKMIRRFVATVDNLPRKEVSARLRPFKPVVGAFDVQGRNGNLAIDLGNARRYEPYVSTVESLNVQMAVKFYATHYSLFQEAYRDLGYPKGQFNDRLFEAIDDMLATPTIAPPIALVQPKVLYRYADPVLENASAGQKMMLRMGVNNAIRVKAVLRKFREGLMYYGRPH